MKPTVTTSTSSDSSVVDEDEDIILSEVGRQDFTVTYNE